jgi:hypothetical protein
MHFDLASGIGQRPVLDGVGRKFLKRHGHGQRHAWRQAGRRAADVDTVFASAAVGLDCLGHDLGEIGGLPVLSGEHIVSVSEGAKPIAAVEGSMKRERRATCRIARSWTAELLRLRRIGSGAALGTLSGRRSRRSRAYGSAGRNASRGLRQATPRSGPTLGPFLSGRTWRPSAHGCARGHAFLGLFGARRIGRVLLLDGRVRRRRTAGRRA